MKESTIMQIHYGTALAAVGLVAVHILMRLTTGFADSLEYENVLANYRSVPYVIMLELILILLLMPLRNICQHVLQMGQTLPK